MKKCLVLSDSFKGSLTSAQIGAIVQEEWLRQFPSSSVRAIPVADGGEGTAECFEEALGAKRVWLTVSGPFGEPVSTFYVRHQDTAIIEMAKAAGLPLAEGRLNPGTTTTFGVGELMRHAVLHGAKQLVLGLGGSATNDAGCGMAAALGVKFMDEKGQAFVPCGNTLCRIQSVEVSQAVDLLKECTVTAMCDIDHPLYGPQGAAFVFAPQKGASDDQVKLLDEGLRHFDEVICRCLGKSVADLPGAGAAGGMGGGIAALLGGCLKPGIETVLDLISFETLASDVDLIITGEGRLDAQSLGGKVVIGVARRAKELGVPVVALVGDFEEPLDAVYQEGVTAVFGINQPMITLEEAKHRAPEMLRQTCRNLFLYTRGLEEVR